ncbi:MAG: hypothetical protein IIA82_10080 [Thaumarchaeota archaeon]|nr:hypothetical protein [Nitrososphaerota archaeon]
MSVFSESEKEAIVAEVRTKYQCKSDIEFKSYVEVIAGLRIINKILGREWYQRAAEGIEDFDDNSLQAHPIRYYLKMDEPKKIVRLLNFANFLRNLYGKCNLDEKIKEFTRKQKHAPITTESFNKLYTELKIASHFIENGFKVEFLKETKSKKTPDLKITANDGCALIECKRKKDDDEILVESLTNSILEANSQLEDSEIPAIIFVDIPISDDFQVKSKTREVSWDEIFLQLKTVHYVLVSGEWQAVIPGRVRTRSYMYSFENKTSELKLSPSIEDMVRDIKPTPLKSSLLMD